MLDLKAEPSDRRGLECSRGEVAAACPFRRLHGLGNDYVFLSERDAAAFDRAALAAALSDRHFGVGGDGLICIDGLSAESGADLAMRMWNADGSESGMCGNGLRCAVLFALSDGLGKAWTEDLLGRLRNLGSLRIRTGRGVVMARVPRLGLHAAEVEIDVGPALFEVGAVPARFAWVENDASLVGCPPATFDWCGAEFDSAAESWIGDGTLIGWSLASMGNPHLVLELATPAAVASFALSRIGPRLEHAPAFPQRTNVHVAAIDGPDRFVMRTWERGSGITLACGSGAAATFAVLGRQGRLADSATAQLPGGNLRLSRTDAGSIELRGEAVESCRGTAAIELLLERRRAALVAEESS